MPRRPLVIPRTEWDRLKVQVDHEREASAAEKQAAYVQSLNEASYNMTKMWENSYERMLQRQEEERTAKKAAEDESRMAFYRQLLERKRIERETMLAEARDTFFKQKDEPKTLESALMCAEVLREQEAQRKFNEQLREERREREKQEAQEIKQKSEEWLEDQRTKHQRRREINKEVAKIIIDQREEVKAREIMKREQQFKDERTDIANSNKEMEEIRKFEKEFKLIERQKLRDQGEAAIKSRENKRKEEKVIEELEDKLIDIYERTNCKIQNLTKQRTKELVDRKNKIRSILKSKYPNLEKKRLEKEEENYLRAKEEIQKREDILLNKKKALKEAVIKDKQKCYEEWLVRDAENREKEATFKAWEITNRFENSRHTDQFNKQMRERKKKDIAEYKEFILKQQREVEAEKAREKEERYTFYHTERLADMEAADKKFMNFATNLIEECKETNRPINPLVKVVDDYKARYMNPPKSVPKHLKTHFPPFATEQNMGECVPKRREDTEKLDKHPEVREPRNAPMTNGIQDN